jgi:hypothetical protein
VQHGILRYEVPMSKVKGYVPMLLKAMESEFINLNVSGIDNNLLIEDVNLIMEEAEVLADLRSIKPTYQYSPATEDRQASLINDVPLFSRGRRDDTGANTQENIQLVEVEEIVKESGMNSIIMLLRKKMLIEF